MATELLYFALVPAGCPRPDDILLFSVPVCGPYNFMQSFKYKVKVIPGTLKKGKAARQALELLSRWGPRAPGSRGVRVVSYVV
jgi:hypothetical protein